MKEELRKLIEQCTLKTILTLTVACTSPLIFGEEVIDHSRKTMITRDLKNKEIIRETIDVVKVKSIPEKIQRYSILEFLEFGLKLKSVEMIELCSNSLCVEVDIEDYIFSIPSNKSKCKKASNCLKKFYIDLNTYLKVYSKDNLYRKICTSCYLNNLDFDIDINVEIKSVRKINFKRYLDKDIASTSQEFNEEEKRWNTTITNK